MATQLGCFLRELLLPNLLLPARQSVQQLVCLLCR
jgi:hypothetical protein